MGFLSSQLFKVPAYPTSSVTGQTVVITGSNIGLGKEAARHYVRLGASKLILAVRNLDKGHDARNDIMQTTNRGENLVEVWKLDMASYASVQAFATRVENELERVDIFIANAGIAPAKYSVAEDNEASITVNVISTFLLAALVMPKLKETASKFKTRPTFTITSSDVHGHTKFPQSSAPDGRIFATINDKAKAEANWNDQYPISKLLEVFGVRAIAEKHPVKDFPVTINCVNPGLCHSELGRDYPTFGFWLIKLVLARSTEIGSRTLVHAGCQGADSHGMYLSDCMIVEPATVVTSDEGKVIQKRVWEELATKLNAIQPGVTSNF
jgi:NAD(P)-dependent dehydrogenase (short-subunit alcohol dehydrogenase family)